MSNEVSEAALDALSAGDALSCGKVTKAEVAERRKAKPGVAAH